MPRPRTEDGPVRLMHGLTYVWVTVTHYSIYRLLLSQQQNIAYIILVWPLERCFTLHSFSFNKLEIIIGQKSGLNSLCDFVMALMGTHSVQGYCKQRQLKKRLSCYEQYSGSDCGVRCAVFVSEVSPWFEEGHTRPKQDLFWTCSTAGQRLFQRSFEIFNPV